MHRITHVKTKAVTKLLTEGIPKNCSQRVFQTRTKSQRTVTLMSVNLALTLFPMHLVVS